MFNHPISTNYLDQQVARASAVLPAAGAWDASPTEMDCPGFREVLLSLTYTEGAVGGAVDIKIEVSPDSTGNTWHQLSVKDVGVLVPGADVVSDVQREEVSYDPTGATAERFVYGPIEIGGTVERMRVFAQESGVVGNPGTCEIEARFAV
jgi:hypothetical protein